MTMLNAVEEIVAVVGPELLTAEQLAAVFERFKGVFAMSEERRQERALRRSQEDFDEEEAEALQARANARCRSAGCLFAASSSNVVADRINQSRAVRARFRSVDTACISRVEPVISTHQCPVRSRDV